MSITQQYLELRLALSAWNDHEPNPITLEELAGFLFCSERNVKLILRKMAEEGWVTWSPGRGRGNRSSMTFEASREQVVLESAMRLVKKGELPEALEQIRHYGDGTAAKERFMEWLSGYFGYQSEPTASSQKQILRFPIRKPIHSLDPAGTFFDTDANVIRQVFDTLVRFDPNRREVIGHIAHHWESNESRTSWTFYIRKGVQFHHGRELVADDVVFSMERHLDRSSGSAYKWLYTEMVSVRAINASTVVFELSASHHLFPQFLSSHAASILPRDVCELRGASFFKSPIGSGPFRVVANLPAICRLEAFPAYFKGRAHLDQVEIIPIPEQSLSMQDIPWNQIVVHSAPQRTSPNQSWSSEEKVFQGCSVITFNLNKPSGPQQRLAFRQALHHLTDRSRMIGDIGETRMYCASSFTPGAALTTEDFAFHEGLGLKRLAETPYGGEPFHLCTTSPHLEEAEWLQKQYESFGIAMRISVLTVEEMLDPSHMEAADGYLFRLLLKDEVAALFEHFRSDLSYIRAHMGAEMRAMCDRLLTSLLQEPDAESRLDLIRLAERLLAEDRSLLFLHHIKQVTTHHSAVRGFRYNLLGGIDFKDIWFQET